MRGVGAFFRAESDRALTTRLTVAVAGIGAFAAASSSIVAHIAPAVVVLPMLSTTRGRGWSFERAQLAGVIAVVLVLTALYNDTWRDPAGAKMLLAHLVTLAAIAVLSLSNRDGMARRCRVIESYALGTLAGAVALQVATSGIGGVVSALTLHSRLGSAAGSEALALVLFVGVFASRHAYERTTRVSWQQLFLLLGILSTGSRIALALLCGYLIVVALRTYWGVIVLSLGIAVTGLVMLSGNQSIQTFVKESRYVRDTFGTGPVTSNGTIGYRLTTYDLSVAAIKPRSMVQQLTGDGVKSIRTLQRTHGVARNLKQEGNLGRVIHNDILTFALAYGLIASSLLLLLLARACIDWRHSESVFVAGVAVLSFSLVDNAMAAGFSLALPAVAHGLARAPRLREGAALAERQLRFSRDSILS